MECVPRTECPDGQIYAGIDENGNRLCKNVEQSMNFDEIISNDSSDCPQGSSMGFSIDPITQKVKVDCTVTNDTTPPTILSFNPAAGIMGSAPTTIIVTFSEPMDPLTVTNKANWSMTCNSTPHTITSVTLSGSVATVNISGSMSTSGTCTFTASTAMTDLKGNALAGAIQAIYEVDKTPPTIISRTPSPNSVDIPRTTFVTVTFSEDMDPSTIT